MDVNSNAANGLDESYSYDAFGNLQQSGNYSFIQAYSQDNRLSGWSYDASGNLLIDGNNNGYGYDAEGRVSGPISGIAQYVIGTNGTYTFNPQYSYIYDGVPVDRSSSTGRDADGQRVSKTGPGAADHIYFGGRELARLVGGQWTDLIYGASGLLAEVPGTQNGAPVYRMTDHLGTQVGTLSSTGLLLSATDYAPFGQVFAGGSTDPYKFTGKERDTESGNDYFEARYYSSAMGRFMSPDWSAKEEPVPYAKLDDPQTLNLYSYVGNNPLSRADKDGHCFWDLCIGETYATVVTYTALAAATAWAYHNASQYVSSPQGQADLHAAGQAIMSLFKTPSKPGTAGGDRAGKSFTPKGKQEVIKENEKAHGGQATCENCGVATAPAKQSQPGVSTDPTQT